MRAIELSRDRLPEAEALLEAACAHDRAAAVAAEKLFGAAPSPHVTVALGAFDGETLVGVAAVSGRWLRLLAVHPSARRRGAGSLLVAEAEARARGWGARSLRTGDQPGNYLAPGIDARDGESIAWCERRGFARVAESENLRVPLVDNPKVTRERADALAAACVARGYELRRATADDAQALLAYAAAAFTPNWAFEISRALENQPAGVHLVRKDGAPVAFACHDGNNRGLGWFGPAGTDPAHRGQGLGQALLLPCLLDVAAAGHTHGVIAWIGPRAFYEGTAGAESDRRFVVLAKDLW